MEFICYEENMKMYGDWVPYSNEEEFNEGKEYLKKNEEYFLRKTGLQKIETRLFWQPPMSEVIYGRIGIKLMVKDECINED